MGKAFEEGAGTIQSIFLEREMCLLACPGSSGGVSVELGVGSRICVAELQNGPLGCGALSWSVGENLGQ